MNDIYTRGKMLFFDFMNRLDSNWDILFSGIVSAIIGMVLFKALTRYFFKKAKINTFKFENLLVPFIAIFMISAVLLLLKSWNGEDITDGQVLTAIVSFISPFIAFTGAYTIFNLGKEKEKFDIEEKKDNSYKNLYYTLKNTVESTLTQMEKTVNEYCNMIDDPLFKDSDIFSKDKEIHSNLISIYENKIVNLTVYQKLRIEDFKHKVNEIITNTNTNYRILVNDPEWHRNLENTCGLNEEMISKWLNMLSLNKINNDLEFLNCREFMITLINEIAGNKKLKEKYNLKFINVNLYGIDEYGRKQLENKDISVSEKSPSN